MGTWIIGAVIFCMVGLAAYKVYKDFQSGKSCGCDGCSQCYGCVKPDEKRS